MLTMRVKSMFFDTARVRKAVDKGTRKAMTTAGGTIRKIAQNSMKYVTSESQQEKDKAAGKRKRIRSYKPSAPGAAPRAVKPHPFIRKFLYFGYDPAARNVVVGPVKLSRSTNAPERLEHGGSTIRKKNARRRIRRIGDGGEIRIVKGHAIYTRIDTAEQAERANRLNAELYGPEEISIDAKPRPFMVPALKQELPSLPKHWHNTVR